MDDALLRFIRRAIRALLVLIVLGIAANDGIRTATAVSCASDGLNAAKAASVDVASAAPADVAAGQAAAASAAGAVGARLDDYAQTVVESGGSRHATVMVKVSCPLGPTFIAAPIVGLLAGTPPAQWYDAPRIVLAHETDVNVF